MQIFRIIRCIVNNRVVRLCPTACCALAREEPAPRPQAGCGEAMPPKGSGKPKGKRKSRGNSTKMQDAAAPQRQRTDGGGDDDAPAPQRQRTDGGDAAAPPAAAPDGYRVGVAVEYYSETLGGWAQAKVMMVHEDGTIDVQTLETQAGSFAACRLAERISVPGDGVLRLAGSGGTAAASSLVTSAEPPEARRKRMRRESKAERAAEQRRSASALAQDVAAPAGGGGAAAGGDGARVSDSPAVIRKRQRDAKHIRDDVTHDGRRSPAEQQHAIGLAAKQDPALFSDVVREAVARDPAHLVGNAVAGAFSTLKERKSAATTGNLARPGNDAAGVAPQDTAAARSIKQTLLTSVAGQGPEVQKAAAELFGINHARGREQLLEAAGRRKAPGLEWTKTKPVIGFFHRVPPIPF